MRRIFACCAVAVALAAGAASHARAAQVVAVGKPLPVRGITPGFVGLSLEYSAIEPYVGADPAALNPAFVQLVRNLDPGQRPVLRIGGDSTDWAWWPTPAVRRPRGIRIDLTRTWLAVTRSLATALDAKLILGINLEADSRALASAEARAFVSRIGRAHVQSLELGNEPELYHAFGWYTNKAGEPVPGRGPTWSFSNYLRDFTKIADGLPRVPLAGPAIGSPGWLASTGAFARAQRRAKTITIHRYPLLRCPAAAPAQSPTIAQLLAPAASAGLADSVIPFARAARANGDSIRVDEMNSVACGGAPGVSNTFASALWSIDALFQMARVGIDGVNIHTFNSAIYGLFHVQEVGGVWSADVRPDYYGLLLFAQAAPPGSHLLGVAGAAGSLRAWATRARDGRTRVVLINDDPGQRRQITVRMPGAHGDGALERLLAPGLGATGGITLGGRTFGARTTTGQFAGPPRTRALTPHGRSYAVSLPAASAALLTLR
ncbi:MAG: glycosyl hydrolase family 79 C-terminal domain-containing protein [Solirubrobacteraceae bacterium]